MPLGWSWQQNNFPSFLAPQLVALVDWRSVRGERVTFSTVGAAMATAARDRTVGNEKNFIFVGDTSHWVSMRNPQGFGKRE